MSGGSGTNNNWTILTSEETVAETLRPFAAGPEQHDQGQTSATGGPGSGESNQPAKSAESAEGLPVGDDPVSEQKAAGQRAELGSHQHSSSSAPSVEVSGVLDRADDVGPTEGQAEGPARPGSDPTSSSDSYTLLTPSLHDRAEFTQAEDDETLRLRNEREPEQKGEESEQHPQTPDTGRQAEVNEERTEETGERGEPEERRKKSLLAALEQIGRRQEEEEEEEEEFQVLQQENSVFSLNKCILGAVLLLAIGTIFFSESDSSTDELRDAEAAGKQEWLSPEVPPHVGADSSQLLNKLAEGNEQISALQAQLQAQNEELKVAKEQAAEGVKERLLWEEVEKENSRLKTEMTSLPVLQKENDRMKRELESVPALQKELETLRSKLKLSSAADQTPAEASFSSSPPAGQSEDSSQDAAGDTERTRTPWDNQKEKRDKYETSDKKRAKELEKSARKEEQKEFKKEWKREKHEGMFEKEKAGKHKRQSDEMKSGKREKSGRGEEGKQGKEKEVRGWKKGKQENVNEGEERKERQGEKKGKEGWRGGKEWKKEKDGSKESGKEKWEKKAWKETGEKREWKKNGEWRDKNRDQGKEERRKDGRKQWENGFNHEKEKRKQGNEYERKSKNEKQDEEWKRKDETDEWRRGQKEKKSNKDWKKEEFPSLKTSEHKPAGSHEHREEHLYGEQTPPHSHRRPAVGQPEYWAQQRDRLRRDPRPPQNCNSPESCAQTERLLPVTSPEFQAVLQPYLSKAEDAGVDASYTQELRKLAAEFFKDGVFVHEQMSFQDFVEDVTDVLEDLVEGDDEEQEDSALEDEMEEFEKEVVKRFSTPGGGGREKKVKEEWRKKSGQERG